MNRYFLKDNAHIINTNQVIAGLDVGKKFIGVAISNPEQSISTPYTTVKRTRFAYDMSLLAGIFSDYQAKILIVGFPVNMDGSVNPTCDMIDSFVDEMIKIKEVSEQIKHIFLWDERLSTFEAKELFKNDLKNKKAKEKGITDKLAAHIILQSALDYMKSTKK